MLMVCQSPQLGKGPDDPGSDRAPLGQRTRLSVSVMDGDDGTKRLGEYLRARRALVTPKQAGLVASSNRRVSGLRREEVALLAGISADYYLRLERGRDSNPSVQVLESLSRVLLLDDVETAYLMGLGTSRPSPRRRRHIERVPERFHHLLDVIDAPAFVEGRYFDVLAANHLATAFSPRLAPGNNRLRSMLLDPEEQEFHLHWERDASNFIALFRNSIADDVGEPRAIELVGELSLASAQFRKQWGRHDVRPFAGGATEVVHPMVGGLQLNREKLRADDLVLVVYYAAGGSSSAEKLRMLASLATSG
jgi:transcriptional regulator with XRE-family HTH domain